jgi:hypothetical protein
MCGECPAAPILTGQLPLANGTGWSSAINFLNAAAEGSVYP